MKTVTFSGWHTEVFTGTDAQVFKKMAEVKAAKDAAMGANIHGFEQYKQDLKRNWKKFGLRRERWLFMSDEKNIKQVIQNDFTLKIEIQ